MNRTFTRALAGTVAAAALLGLADTAWASFDEARLANEGEQAYIGGFPHALSKVTGKVPRTTVEQLDVEITGFGAGAEGPPGTIGASSTIGTVGVDVIDHVQSTQRARLVRRRIRLDGVGFGELLGVSDLEMANPYDISPAGGAASEARLTGTLPGMEEPASAVVTLRLRDGIFQMRPSEILTVPEGKAPEDVVKGFTLEFDTRSLPLAGAADRVQIVGGSIEFARERRNTTVTPEDFHPLSG